MRYYIGIDGGGTKTAVCAASTEASLEASQKASQKAPHLRYAVTAGSSWREHGALKVAQSFKETVRNLMGDEYNLIGGIAMGLSCHGESPEGDRVLEQALLDQFSGIPLYFTNDVEAGWAGSMALQPGINIVAGTGAIAFGKDIHGKMARCGGWSEFFGDEGSCYWIGRKVMELFSKQSDGRLPRDELYDIVRSELKLKDDFSFIDLVYNEYMHSREKVASLQLLAGKAASAGSPSAKALYREAVRELLLLAVSIRNQLDFGDTWNVSYSGGLFKAGDVVLSGFLQEIESQGGKVFVPRFGPVEGAVLLAFQHFNPDGLMRIKEILTENKT